ncbi:alpha-N-acetylgalactosaminidase-like [Asterias rubens]|uniref:alpha-N-acetylgalactosaminidase-like n=1 Tax=Asterias rubens TaxID=7604 RepID=UPI001455574C|nr:alpha-N-acetylgalactosaminidase-like [Asterias rubens]XP_033646281.1 alpha-N-acetylgalactosaminidase-like [Asterias rubens]
MDLAKSAVLFFTLSSLSLVEGLDNGLARTPPMGWNSWERFRCNIDCENDPKNCISEVLYREMADALADGGFKQAGYEFINMDDCWMSKARDAQGRLQPDPLRFPNGLKALADYIHSKGLKFGLYQSMGLKTCAGYPGIWGHIEDDAKTYAEWGIDLVKMDSCYNLGKKLFGEGFINMSRALIETHRPIVFSCEWAHELNPNFTEIGEYCNSVRDFEDMQDSWDKVLFILDWFASMQDILANASGPGRYNDADFLIIGDFTLSYEQAQSQMALWSVMTSQLFMSNDLRDIDPKMKEILLNLEVIAVNQDKLGKMGKRIYKNSYFEVWTKVMENGSYAAVIFSRATDMPHNFTTTMKDLKITDSPLYSVRDLFKHKDIGNFKQNDKLEVSVNPNGVVMIKATPTNNEQNASLWKEGK